jgi:hypothetical protein
MPSLDPIRRRFTPVKAAFAAGAATILALLVRSVRGGAGVARTRWQRRPGYQTAALRARARKPLENLFDVHPEALRAPPRELGLRTIPTHAIRGTAVQGPQQRGGDFLPLPPFRSNNWQSRWQRIRNAVESLALLPPIEVIKYGDEYWVTDGHNRVAAANYYGQVGVDALVTELRQPGRRFEAARPGMAAVLADGRALRAAGQGRLATTTALPLTDEEVHPSDAPIHDETAMGPYIHDRSPIPDPLPPAKRPTGDTTEPAREGTPES